METTGETRDRFDQVVDRRGTDSVKWDHADGILGGRDLLPMWVADMDFPAPPEVTEQLVKRARHGIFGYTIPPESLYRAIMDWTARRYDWSLEREWLVLSSTVVTSINLVIQALTEPGDRIVVQSPVYPPFFKAVRTNHRDVVDNPLVFDGQTYRMDVDALDKQIDERTKLLLLCSPQNPTGRVWTRAELESLGEVVSRHSLIVVADEIHADIIYSGHRFVPFASIDTELAQRTVSCIAPSKTFNIAGMKGSAMIIPDPVLRQAVRTRMTQLGLQGLPIFAHIAMETAYRCGESWLEAVVKVLEGNVDAVQRHLRERVSDVRLVRPEGTFLVWLDFSGTGLTHEEVVEALLQRAKLGLNDGRTFGPGGRGFMRMNIGCPRALCNRAMEALRTTFGRTP